MSLTVLRRTAAPVAVLAASPPASPWRRCSTADAPTRAATSAVDPHGPPGRPPRRHRHHHRCTWASPAPSRRPAAR